MSDLFEAFIRNFLKRECPQWSDYRRRENISWRASSITDPTLALLPRMQTDISLARPGRYLVVDAKYYRKALQTNYNVDKVRNENLYQLLSYILNAPQRADMPAEGMLLYPRVNRSLRERYEILGREISICTVDLSQSWMEIDRELKELFR
jgi:5-methylcytosine-specific restriction enzyme subunit McrC